MAGTVYNVAYPTLDIDLSTLKGRQECYDAFTHFTLKVEQYFNYSGSYPIKFFGKEVEKAKRRMVIIHSTTSTYRVFREAFLGPNWMKNMDFVTANGQLNTILNSTSMDEFNHKVLNYLRDVQQRALMEQHHQPPGYDGKMAL